MRGKKMEVKPNKEKNTARLFKQRRKWTKGIRRLTLLALKKVPNPIYFVRRVRVKIPQLSKYFNNLSKAYSLKKSQNKRAKTKRTIHYDYIVRVHIILHLYSVPLKVRRSKFGLTRLLGYHYGLLFDFKFVISGGIMVEQTWNIRKTQIVQVMFEIRGRNLRKYVPDPFHIRTEIQTIPFVSQTPETDEGINEGINEGIEE